MAAIFSQTDHRSRNLLPAETEVQAGQIASRGKPGKMDTPKNNKASMEVEVLFGQHSLKEEFLDGLFLLTHGVIHVRIDKLQQFRFAVPRYN